MQHSVLLEKTTSIVSSLMKDKSSAEAIMGVTKMGVKGRKASPFRAGDE
ncbi:MAG: hypothetical protein RXO22_09320 [Thermocladium sp.]